MRIVAIAVALLALVAGCGGGGDDGSDGVAALIARAVSNSEQAESYRLTVVAEVTGQQGFRMEAEGVSAADQSRGRYEGTMALNGQPARDVEFISVEGSYFFRGGFFGSLPRGKEWVLVEDDQPTTMTPSEFARFLEASDDIENVGTEQVRGRPAVHLSGPLDFEQLAKSTGPEAESYLERIPGAEDLTAEIDVWLRENTGEMVRMAAVMTDPKSKARIEMRGDILEYDVSLAGVDRPDPSTVFEP